MRSDGWTWPGEHSGCTGPCTVGRYRRASGMSTRARSGVCRPHQERSGRGRRLAGPPEHGGYVHGGQPFPQLIDKGRGLGGIAASACTDDNPNAKSACQSRLVS